MVNTAIFGASGYTGAALVEKVLNHPLLKLNGIHVSAQSKDAGKDIADVHPSLAHFRGHTLIATDDDMLQSIASENQVIFLATPHEASHSWVPKLLNNHAVVFDLSGAYRLSNSDDYAKFYGFNHQHQDWLDQAVYGLAEHNHSSIASAQLVAVPGCYPTASLSALLPLQKHQLLDNQSIPVINAVSGVSGAGRKAALTNSFCEVSLQAYGTFSHRHTPEIAQQLGQNVIFTPHLGNFKRGILATVTAKLAKGVFTEQVDDAFAACYGKSKLIRMLNSQPKVGDVAHSPFCDLFWHVDENLGHVIVTSAIDNLLKGAATQAIQCANIRQGWSDDTGLVGLVQ